MNPKSYFHVNKYNENVCCTLFTKSLGSGIEKVSDLIVELITEAENQESEISDEDLKARIILIRATYVVYKSYYESALLSAQKRNCGKNCCIGIASGLLSTTLGITNISVTNAFNPLFSNEEVAAALSLSIEELAGAFETILHLSGCKDYYIYPEILAHFDDAYKSIL